MSDVLTILHNHIVSLISEGGLILLFVSAYINNMPESLPGSWREVPQWFWTWNAHSLKAFMNARAGASASHVESIGADGSRKTTDLVTAAAPSKASTATASPADPQPVAAAAEPPSGLDRP